MPLHYAIRKCTGGYKFTKSPEKINQRISMDDIKLFAKNEKELETLNQTIGIYSQDRGIEFNTEKCALLIIKSRKRDTTEEI